VAKSGSVEALGKTNNPIRGAKKKKEIQHSEVTCDSKGGRGVSRDFGDREGKKDTWIGEKTELAGIYDQGGLSPLEKLEESDFNGKMDQHM